MLQNKIATRSQTLDLSGVPENKRNSNQMVEKNNSNRLCDEVWMVPDFS